MDCSPSQESCITSPHAHSVPSLFSPFLSLPSLAHLLLSYCCCCGRRGAAAAVLLLLLLFFSSATPPPPARPPSATTTTRGGGGKTLTQHEASVHRRRPHCREMRALQRSSRHSRCRSSTGSSGTRTLLHPEGMQGEQERKETRRLADGLGCSPACCPSLLIVRSSHLLLSCFSYPLQHQLSSSFP